MQEAGTRLACGLPYVVNAYDYADFAGAAAYNLSVYGPNGFLRAYAGSLANRIQLQSMLAYNIGQVALLCNRKI